MSDLSGWLARHGLGRLAAIFVEQDIGADVLPLLDASDLAELGLTIGDRHRLLQALADDPPVARPAAKPKGPWIYRDAQAKAHAEQRQVTIMFCDLVGSTGFSTRLDAEDLRDLLRIYQDTSVGAVARYGGFVSRFMGDGILVLFGYPVAYEDSAERAVRAALEIVPAVEAMPRPEGLDPDVRLSVRIGIATGVTVVGDVIGDGSALEHGVVGETPNLAARLQSFAHPGAVVVADRTRALTDTVFDYESLGVHPFKGFAEPLPVWRPCQVRDPVDRFDAAHPAALTPLAGREAEVDLIVARWEQARAGHAQFVVLMGEPGIGKSRIARELRERVSGTARHYLRYQCSPYHRNTALHPFVSQLRRAAELLPGDGADAALAKLAALLRLSPDTPSPAERQHLALFAALLSLPVDLPLPALTADEQRELTFRAVIEQLDRLAAEGPVLIVFEDVHWADPTSLELLERLESEAVARARAEMVLITARPEVESGGDEIAPQVHASLAEIRRKPHTTVLDLDRLSPADSGRIVEAICAGGGLPAAAIERIVQRVDGIPLFAEELTKAVVESGVLDGVDGDALDHLVPATLHDSLMARLDRLPEIARDLAQIGAAIGREFPRSLLSAVAGVESNALHGALHDLLRSELVYRRRGVHAETFVFKHALVQEVAYQSMLRRDRRVSLHLAIARAMERSGDGTAEAPPEVVAHHLTEAGEYADAIECWALAGRGAAERSAHREAINHLSRALGLTARLPESPGAMQQDLALSIDIGSSRAAVDGYAAPQRREIYLRAIGLCERLGDRPELLVALSGLAGYHYVAGELEEAAELARRCLALAEASPDLLDLVEAHRLLGEVLFYLGDMPGASTHLQACIDLYHRVEDGAAAYAEGDDPGVMCRMYLAICEWLTGQESRALETCADGLRLSERLAVYTRAQAQFYAAWLHALRGEPADAERYASASIALCEDRDFRMYLGLATVLHGWACGVQRHSNTALDDVERGMSLIRETDAGVCLSCFLPWQAELLLANGRPAEADVAIDEAFATAGERFYDAERLRLRAKVNEVLGGDSGSVTETLAEAVAVAESQGLDGLAARAAGDLVPRLIDAGRDAAAAALCTRLTARLDRHPGADGSAPLRRWLSDLGSNAASAAGGAP